MLGLLSPSFIDGVLSTISSLQAKKRDDISKINGISRSKFISTVLYEKVLAENKKKVRNAYDTIFSDSAICKEQLDTAKWFANTDVDEGQEW